MLDQPSATSNDADGHSNLFKVILLPSISGISWFTLDRPLTMVESSTFGIETTLITFSHGSFPKCFHDAETPEKWHLTKNQRPPVPAHGWIDQFQFDFCFWGKESLCQCKTKWLYVTCIFILMQIKVIFMWNVLHKHYIWKRGKQQLEVKSAYEPSGPCCSMKWL